MKYLARVADKRQDAPMLWDAVRTAVDNAGGEPGQYTDRQ